MPGTAPVTFRFPSIRRIAGSALLLCLMPAAALAGKYAGEFLERGVGARGLGMGQALTALSDDPYSFYWNPAGLAFVDQRSVSGMANTQFGSITDPMGQSLQLGFTMPIGLANLALNYLRFQVDEIPRFPDYPDALYSQEERRRLIEEVGGRPSGTFQNVDQAFFFSFAKLNEWTLNFGWFYRELPLTIPIGANFKLIHSSLDDQSATGIGADAGLQVLFELEDLISLKNLGRMGLGARFENFTNTGLKWDGGSDAINYNFVMGLSWSRQFGETRLSLARDLDHRYRTFSRNGLEMAWREKVFLRAGHQSTEDRWTYGAGFRFHRVQVDYAGFDHDLGRLHRISLVLDL